MRSAIRTICGLALVLALAAGVQAQPQHQPGREPAAQSAATPSAMDRPGMMPMMEQMQGMMEQMEDMMEQMQGMMPSRARGERGGMHGRHGMMGHHRGRGHGGMIERLLQQLDLSNDQETQVRALLRRHQKDAIRARAEIEVKTIELRELFEAEPVDLAAVKAQFQNLATMKADLHYARVVLVQQDIRKLLTPEQQEQFRLLRNRMLRHHGGMMEQGEGGEGMQNPCGMMGGGPRDR